MSAERRLTPAVADVLLLLCAAIWGISFLWQTWANEHTGPLSYVGARCLLGGLVVLPLALRRRAATPRGPRSALLLGGLLTGACMALGSALQQIGLQTTTVTNAGFITGLYVVFVPFLGVFIGQRVSGRAWVAVLLAAIGLYWLSFHDQGGSAATPIDDLSAPPAESGFALHEGDLYVLGCALTWALHVQVVGWASRRCDPVALSVLQFFVGGAMATGFALAFESPTAAGMLAAAWPIALSAVFAVGIAFTLQAVAQDVAPPTHTAILLSLESVFAAATGVVWMGEPFGGKQAAGAALLLTAALAAQWPTKANQDTH